MQVKHNSVLCINMDLKFPHRLIAVSATVFQIIPLTILPQGFSNFISNLFFPIYPHLFLPPFLLPFLHCFSYHLSVNIFLQLLSPFLHTVSLTVFPPYLPPFFYRFFHSFSTKLLLLHTEMSLSGLDEKFRALFPDRQILIV